MLNLSNPRSEAVIENWPLGSGRRGPCTFRLESNKRGERVTRQTTGKPKATTYYGKIRIVDGDDGRTYLLAKSPIYDTIYVLSSNMQHQVSSHNPDSPEYAAYAPLLA